MEPFLSSWSDGISIRTTVLYLSLCLVGSICARVVYLCYLHPLASYPGPFISRFTNIRGAYHGLLGDIHLDMSECHEKYGEFVRYGPNKLLVNSPLVLRDIYGYKKNLQKATSYLPLVPDGKGWSTLTCIDKDMHRSKRRLLSEGLSDAALRTFEPKMLQHMALFRAKLDASCDQSPDGWSSPKDLSLLFKWMTLDVMAEFGFGESTRLQEEEDNRFLVDCIDMYLWRMGCYYESGSLERLDPVLLAYLWMCGKWELGRKFVSWKEEFGARVIATHGGTKKGILSRVLDHVEKEGERGYTEDEVWAEGIFLMLAGSDTSTTALSALFFHLSRYSHAYRRLADEIRGKFQEVAEINTPTVTPCQYLHACITETLRLAPSTPGAPWREIGEGGAFLGDRYMPQGCNVGTSIYAIHRRDDVFKNPHEFIPERWLTTDQRQLDHMYQTYNPFSLGPRGCIGRSMAFAEVSILAAQIMLEYDFRPAAGDAGKIGAGDESLRTGRQNPMEFQLESHVTALSRGPVLSFRRRDIAKAEQGA